MSRHSSVFLVFSVLLCIHTRTCVRFGLSATHLHVREDNRAMNLLEFSLDSVNASKVLALNKSVQSSNVKFQRVPENAHLVNVTTLVSLNNSHTILSIQYAGRGTEAIVAFAQFSSASVPNPAVHSVVFVSYDDGQSFHKKTFNATRETSVTSMYFSPVFNSNFIFADVPNKMLFISTDFLHSTIEVSISFQPDIISYHRSNEGIVLAMDKQEQTLWLSRDFGETWDLVHRKVKSFFWDTAGTWTNTGRPKFAFSPAGSQFGIHAYRRRHVNVVYTSNKCVGNSSVGCLRGVEDVDEKTTLFVERMDTSGTSTLLKSSQYFQKSYAITVISEIEDVQVIGKYIFATKRQKLYGSNNDSLQLLVSYNREDFEKAVFPSNLIHSDYLIADASEDHVFVYVRYPDMFCDLYISDEHGINYTFSLYSIFFYSEKRYNSDVWLSEERANAFPELHKVDGLRGIYIASQIFIQLNEDDQLGLNDLRTSITFDNGRTWQIITPPEFDYEGRNTNCSKRNNCHLHLTQEFSMSYPESMITQPILSKKSALGSILSTGILDVSLKGHPNFYVSPDAGVSWRQALSGQYLYNFGDHGGIIVAVKHFKAQGQTNEILYSTDTGETWETYKFLDREIYVFGLLSEPEEKTTVFTLFGSDVDNMQLIVVRIDLRNAFKYKCNESDYEMWSPSLGSDGTRNCLLGRRDVYKRRVPNSNCYNGQDFEGYASSESCECTRDDYECDTGFTLDSLIISNATVCFPENHDAQSDVVASCITGHFYNRTKGYRKIQGNSCKGGLESRYESELISCPTKDEQEYLLFAQRRNISRLSLAEDSEPEELQIPNLKEVIAVEYDYNNGSIFWADVKMDKIMRFHLDGKRDMEILLEGDIQHIESMAFDWISQNLYFVDYLRRTIEVIRTDVNNVGRLRRTVLNETVLQSPRGLAVHPVEGYMFWTDWGSEKPYVGRAFLDGSNPKLLFTKPLVFWPNGVTVDYQIQRIYWVDAKLGYIASANLDGGDMNYIIRNTGILSSAFAIAVHNHSVYWSSWDKMTIYSADKYNGREVRSVVSGLSEPMSIKIVSRTLQQGTNQCAANASKCTHLCIGLPNKGMSCLCPDGVRVEKSSSGNERCLCDNGEDMLTNGTCRTLTCSEDKFACNSGGCISKRWHCDGDKDCADNSDEVNCTTINNLLPTSSSPATTLKQSNCLGNYSQCSNGLCIPHSWKCDGEKDCGDGSDEVNCTNAKCSKDKFACNNGNCISLKWKCDSDDDCLDGSDEVGCENQTAVCKQGELLCISTNTCLPSISICDTNYDCPDGSDEKNCTTISTLPPTSPSPATTMEPVHCSKGYYQCSNIFGPCIPKWWKCDGEKDCSDGSDELDCGSTRAPTTTSTEDSTTNYNVTTQKLDNCTGSKFICSNGICIPYWWKCDGTIDCSDGSDELDCGTTKVPTTSTEKTTLGTTTIAVTTLKPGNCSADYYPCSNGRCIPKGWKCDGEKDCSDGSDELDCGTTTRAPTTSTEETRQTTARCAENYFKCRNGRCIHESRLCDSVADCYGQEDEANCTVRHLFIDRRTVTSTGFTLNWEPLKKRSIEYLPSISEVKSNTWSNVSWTVRSSRNFTHLKPLTTYNVTVYVKIHSHIFRSNAYISITTQGGVPRVVPSPPETVTASQINSEMVRVLWKPPTNQTTLVTGYRIYILPPLPPRREDVIDPKQTNFEIKGYFRPGNSYIFWMTALSENDESAASAPIFLTFYEDAFSEAVSGLRVLNATDISVLIAWDPLSTAPDGYMISVAASWAYVKNPLSVAGPKQNTYNITDLAPNMPYIITVLGYQGSRKGPPVIVVGRTTGKSLQAPTNFTATMINGTTVELTWIPPVDPRDAKWVYGVFYATGLEALVDFAPKANTSDTKLIVGGLEACKRYSFNIRLIGPLGYGPWGDMAVIKTKYDPLGPPKDIAVSRSSDNEQQIVISWNASCHILDEPIGYKIYVNETKLNRVSWFALAPTTELKQELYLKTNYGGRYEIIIQTDYIGSRPANKVYYDAPPIPAPHHVRIFADYILDNYNLSWEEPNLPAGLKNVKLQYVVRIAENSSDVMSGSESLMKRPPLVFNTIKGKPFLVAVALRDERGLESALSETIAVDGSRKWTYLMDNNLNKTANIK